MVIVRVGENSEIHVFHVQSKHISIRQKKSGCPGIEKDMFPMIFNENG